MSGFHAMFVGGGTSGTISVGASLSQVLVSGTAQAGMTFNTDGSISYTGGGSGSARWYSGTPPSSVWMSWTVTGSANMGSGGSQQMTSARTFSYSCTLNGTITTGSITCSFYGDSGLTQNLGGGAAISVDVESSNR